MRRAIFAAVSVIQAASSYAAGLDPSFGTDGVLSIDVGTSGNAQANGAIRQSDGKIVIVGTSPATVSSMFAVSNDFLDENDARDMLVVRVDGDGKLDPTFGTGGVAQIDINSRDDQARAVAQQPDGKLVIVGTTLSAAGDFDIAAIRLLTNGTLDPSFGSGGKVSIDIPVTYGGGGFLYMTTHLGNAAYSVLVEPDGRILIGGATEYPTTSNIPSCASLTRLQSDGSIDLTYGPDASGSLCAFGSAAFSMARESSGSFITAPGNAPLEVDADGKIETLGPTTFQTGSSFPLGFSVLSQPDGGFLLSGSLIVNNAAARWSIMRFASISQVDTTFGTGGVTTDTTATYEGLITSTFLEPGGMIMGAGFATRGSDPTSQDNALLVRLRGDGTPDPNFGANGALFTPFDDGTTSYSYRPVATMRADDGKLFMVGNRGTLAVPAPLLPALSADSQRIVLARFVSTPQYSVAQPATVSSTAASVAVQITRTGTTSDPVSVQYFTSDGLSSGTVTWQPGDADTKSISLPIAAGSASKTFSIQLSNPSEGSLDTSSATVTVAADPPAAPAPSGSSADPAPAKSGGGSIDWLLVGALAAATHRRYQNRRSAPQR